MYHFFYEIQSGRKCKERHLAEFLWILHSDLRPVLCFTLGWSGLAFTWGLQHTVYHLLNCHSGDFYRNEIRFLFSFMMTYCRYFSFLFFCFLLPIYIEEVENLREPLFSFIFLKCYYNQSSTVPMSFYKIK